MRSVWAPERLGAPPFPGLDGERLFEAYNDIGDLLVVTPKADAATRPGERYQYHWCVGVINERDVADGAFAMAFPEAGAYLESAPISDFEKVVRRFALPASEQDGGMAFPPGTIDEGVAATIERRLDGGLSEGQWTQLTAANPGFERLRPAAFGRASNKGAGPSRKAKAPSP